MLKDKTFRVSTKHLLISLTFIFWVASSSAQEVISPSNLNYYTENYPPSNYLVDGQLVGMSVDTLKLIWQQMKVPEQPIQVVPWARGYRMTLSQPNSVLFTMARTAGREKLFKWVGPIFTARHVLLARSDFEQEIQTIEDAYEYPIAAIRNDISEVALLEAGFPKNNIAPLTDLKQSILMLENGRLDLLIISQASIKELVEVNNLVMEQFKIVFVVNEAENYFAFHNKTPDRVIEQFQQAFNEISEQRKRLLLKYELALN